VYIQSIQLYLYVDVRICAKYACQYICVCIYRVYICLRIRCIYVYLRVGSRAGIYRVYVSVYACPRIQSIWVYSCVGTYMSICVYIYSHNKNLDTQ